MSYDIKEAIVALLKIFVFVFILCIICFAENDTDKYRWTDGICPRCEGKYKLKGQSWRYDGLTGFNRIVYVYECENCGYTIELNSIQEKGE